MNKNTDEHFEDLLKKVTQAENRKNTVCTLKNKNIEDKKVILLPIVNLLYKIRTNGFMVYPFAYLLLPLTKRKAIKPIQFKYFIEETNGTDLKYDLIHPSPLIVIKDPVQIEIGVINETFRESEGLVNISCGKSHPDFEILSKNFKTVNEAVEAISEFISRNTVSIERNRD